MKLPTLLLLLSLFIMSSVAAAPNFQIQEVACGGGLLSLTAWRATANSEVDCDITVVNQGTSGAMRVEVGIYQESLIEEWYGTASFGLFNPGTDVPNCVPSEIFTDTRLLELNGGASETMDFDLTAPGNWFEQYYVHVATYDECWSSAPDTDGDGEPNTGQTDFYVHSFDVTEPAGGGDPSESCSDGLKNQDETDLDCGGSCGECPDYYRCSIDADCFGSATCAAVQGVNRCVPAGVTPPPPTEPGDVFEKIDGRVVVLLIALAVILAIIFWPSGKKRR